MGYQYQISPKVTSFVNFGTPLGTPRTSSTKGSVTGTRGATNPQDCLTDIYYPSSEGKIAAVLAKPWFLQPWHLRYAESTFEMFGDGNMPRKLSQKTICELMTGWGQSASRLLMSPVVKVDCIVPTPSDWKPPQVE
jgi:hypothetical protein